MLHWAEQGYLFKFLFQQLVSHKGIKILGILRDKGKPPGTAPEQQKGIKLQVLINLARGLSRSFIEDCPLDNPFGIGENPEFLFDKVHFIRKVTDFLVNIKSLGEQIDSDFTVALELEPVPDLGVEVFEIAVVPDHADFINEENRVGGEFYISNIFVIYEITARDFFCRENRDTLFLILKGKFRKQSRFARAFFAKNHNKLIRVEETPCKKMVNHHKGEDTKHKLEEK